MSMLLAVVVLLASSGFTVYKHHCSQMNTTQVSYIVDLTDCNHHEPAEDKHHEHERGCCSHHSESEEGEPVSCEVILDDGGFASCCNTEARYYRLMEKFEVQQIQDIVKIQFIPVLLAVIKTYVPEPGSAKFQRQIISDSGPPLLFGLELIRFIQQFKYHI
jgi:hypothetical protein